MITQYPPVTVPQTEVHVLKAIAETGVETTQATIQLTKEAAERGVDAVLVKNPFYYKSQMTFDVYGHLFPRGNDAVEMLRADKKLFG